MYCHFFQRKNGFCQVRFLDTLFGDFIIVTLLEKTLSLALLFLQETTKVKNKRTENNPKGGDGIYSLLPVVRIRITIIKLWIKHFMRSCLFDTSHKNHFSQSRTCLTNEYSIGLID